MYFIPWVDGIVQILYAEEYHRPDYNEMLSLVYGLISKYQIDTTYIDGANPSFIRSLKPPEMTAAILRDQCGSL